MKKSAEKDVEELTEEEQIRFTIGDDGYMRMEMKPGVSRQELMQSAMMVMHCVYDYLKTDDPDSTISRDFRNAVRKCANDRRFWEDKTKKDNETENRLLS